MENDHKVVDHAPDRASAWDLASEYVAAMAAMGLDGWSVGVEPDPVPGPNGKRGYVVYATPSRRE